ncbi:DNA-directed RNA polymerase III subunit RPC9 [Geodia barretti]|uniref:DNA-directed RNA polymerase III subunit RPC9 n=1 Tax=Geodia barretti TaxID=519541 RepID=A0AA35W8R3_GEOBA|nr:DNA-directed RNA polymerase III subunit RPC9 [Geodia barretti]
MQVIKDNAGMLSNFEVLDFLSESQQKSQGKRPNGRGQNLATVTYETTEYLSKTPAAVQNPTCIENFLKAIAPFNLTKAEKLQLVNLRPMSQVELQLIIEEIDERFSDNKIEEILGIVSSELPPSSPPNDENPVGSDHQ